MQTKFIGVIVFPCSTYFLHISFPLTNCNITLVCGDYYSGLVFILCPTFKPISDRISFELEQVFPFCIFPFCSDNKTGHVYEHLLGSRVDGQTIRIKKTIINQFSIKTMTIFLTKFCNTFYQCVEVLLPW